MQIDSAVQFLCRLLLKNWIFRFFCFLVTESYIFRAFDPACYWWNTLAEISLKESVTAIANFLFWFRKSHAGKCKCLSDTFIHCWKYTRILYLAWREARIARMGNTTRFYLSAERDGERRNGGRVQMRFIHVLYARDIITLSSAYLASASIISIMIPIKLLYEEISPLWKDFFPCASTGS